MAYQSSLKEAEKQEKRKKSTIYSTVKVDEILKSFTSGYEPDMTPFYMNDVTLRDANLLFQMSDHEKDEYLRCSVDPEYFIETYIKFQTDHGHTNVTLFPFQRRFIHLLCDEEWSDKIEEFVPKSRYVVGMMARQSSKTTTTCASLAWYMLFHNDRNCAIVANKDSTAVEIVSKLTEMIKGLPFFLKPGIIKMSAHSMKFDNGCYLFSAATSSSPLTGQSQHFVLVDEAALIPNNIIDNFWKSVFPTLSSSDVSKIVLISTPRGRQNLFYRIWHGAETGTNSFKYIRADWWEHPKHDEAWAAEQKANFGEEEFAQEFELQWDVAATKLIRGTDNQFMDRIKKTFKSVDVPSIPTDLCNNFYWHPDFDPSSVMNQYLKFFISIDTAEGKQLDVKGKDDSDYNVMQIFVLELMNPGQIKRFAIDRKISLMDCIRFRQVGVYIDNENDEELMAKAAKYLVYNTLRCGSRGIDNVRVLVEMNFNGKNWLNLFMDSDNWYDEIVLKTYHTKPVPGVYQKKKHGFKTTTGGTGIGKGYFCEQGAKMITKRQIIISQYNKDDNKCTIAELNAFNRTKKSQNAQFFTYAGEGLHDDLAYTVLNCSRAVEIEEFRDWIDTWFNTQMVRSPRWFRIAELMRIAAMKDENTMTDSDFAKIYTGGGATPVNNFTMQNRSGMRLANGPIGNTILGQPRTFGQLLSRNRAPNPYLNKPRMANPYNQTAKKKLW